MDLKKVIKSVNILNIDWDESTASKDTFLLIEDNDSSFIVSDADEEILILIEFVVCVDLHNIIFTALPLEDNDDTSPPKEINLYKAKNVCVNFDDMSSLSADKVIEGKAKKLSKGQKISLRKKLAFRQLKYLIIYVRANQNDSEKTHLHKIKINGTCNAKLTDANTQQIVQTFDESKYIQRIDELFEKQQSNKLSEEDFYDFVCSKYPNEDITHFLNDCHKFIKNMDSNRLHLRQRNAVCSKKDCVFLKRRHRYKRIGNGNKRSMIGQRLQQIHILCHQYDEEQKMKNNKNYKRQMIKEKNDEKEQQQSNKFITDIKASSASQLNGKYLEYTEGFKFYYHTFYKDKGSNTLGAEFSHESVPNFRNSGVNKHTGFKWWYVLPKYKDLKEEIVDGGHLTLDQLKNEINKAEVNSCTVEGRKLVANGRFEERYSVQKGSAITVNHMLCIMLYTNYDDLQNKLSKTFRKVSDTETFEQLKERHTSFVHLSRFITEAVKCFGNNELKGTVYHGMNALTIFEEFTVRICGPTSTTTSASVAFNFATNNGTVITIQGIRDHFSSNNFDCELWSDYPFEKEKLFIGMNFSMHIVNMHDIRNDIEYEEWINVIRAFSHLFIHGLYLTSPLSQFVEENLRLLIDSVTNQSVKCIPEYIVDTFNHIRMNTKNLSIHLNLLSKNIYAKYNDSGLVFYGGKKFENVYFDKNGNVKWMFINLLFPNLDELAILSQIPDEKELNRFYYLNSVLLTDDMLNDILVFLKVSNIERIGIFAPQNNLHSLKQQAIKFSAKYQENGYHLNIRLNTKNDRNLNECVVLQVIKIVKIDDINIPFVHASI